METGEKSALSGAMMMMMILLEKRRVFQPKSSDTFLFLQET